MTADIRFTDDDVWAERLRSEYRDPCAIYPDGVDADRWAANLLREAIAAERRATVDRIRTRLIGLLTTLPGAVEKYPAVREILDEEAQR